MVRQEAVDSLFAKPGTARRHCMMVSACIVFDVAIYPLMIWFLFIDVPDFLKLGPKKAQIRKLQSCIVIACISEAMCGFTFVVCMYQVILFDLFGQHCTRMLPGGPGPSVSRCEMAGALVGWLSMQKPGEYVVSIFCCLIVEFPEQTPSFNQERSAGHSILSAQAGKNHEKTVSFDRETVFTYIKQTPVQTPR
eukprot:Skav202008  [mRNA]  locus=scaffold1829:92889:103669:- [translate_table: standard]